MATQAEKENKVLEELQRRAREDIRFGTIRVEFKVHEGIIIGGEIVEERKKLG